MTYLRLCYGYGTQYSIRVFILYCICARHSWWTRRVTSPISYYNKVPSVMLSKNLILMLTPVGSNGRNEVCQLVPVIHRVIWACQASYTNEPLQEYSMLTDGTCNTWCLSSFLYQWTSSCQIFYDRHYQTEDKKQPREDCCRRWEHHTYCNV